MKEAKTVVINNNVFKINHFDFFKGQKIRLKLAKLLLPFFGALIGEGIKSQSQKDVSKVLESINPDSIQKAIQSINASLDDDDEILKLINNELLSVVIDADNKPLLSTLQNKFINGEIEYGDVDKLIIEVIMAQGFFGNLMSGFQEIKKTTN